MTPAEFFTRIEILASAAFFIWFIYGRWQQLVIDATRHELFKIRHRVFWMAADGKMDFNSLEYGEVRKNFNALIRFCHKITFPRVAAMTFARPYQLKRQNITEVLARVKDDGVRRILETEWRKAGDWLLVGMLLRSPILLVMTAILVPILPLFSVVVILDRQRLRSRYKAVRNTVERGIELEVSREAEIVPA